MSEPSQIETELNQAEIAINRANDLATGGAEVDLTGLDGCVDKLCVNIAALSKDQRELYKPRLIGLIDNLNNLVKSLSAQHMELSSALKEITSRHRAVSAYGANPGGNKPRKDQK